MQPETKTHVECADNEDSGNQRARPARTASIPRLAEMIRCCLMTLPQPYFLSDRATDSSKLQIQFAGPSFPERSQRNFARSGLATAVMSADARKIPHRLKPGSGGHRFRGLRGGRSPFDYTPTGNGLVWVSALRAK